MVAPTTNTTTTNVLTNSSNNDRLCTNSDDDSRYNTIKSDRHDGDLYVRTSWTDASVALSQLDKVKCLIINKRQYISEQATRCLPTRKHISFIVALVFCPLIVVLRVIPSVVDIRFTVAISVHEINTPVKSHSLLSRNWLDCQPLARFKGLMLSESWK